jgi:hypothetical protein
MSSEYSKDMAVVDWLEELPIEELPDGECQMIVREFREGMMEVQEAIALLEHDYGDELDEYVQQNLEIQRLLQ